MEHKNDSKQRIADLEQEISRLQSKLKKQEELENPSLSPRKRRRTQEITEELFIHGTKRGFFFNSRVRLVLIGVLIGIVALGIIMGITITLSKGFSKFSHKASEALYPQAPATSTLDATVNISNTTLPNALLRKITSPPPTQKPPTPELRAPGL